MPRCSNKTCENMARIGRKYCSTDCFNASMRRQINQRKRKTSRRTTQARKSKMAQLNRNRAEETWYNFRESLPSVDWEEELTYQSVRELAQQYQISYYLLRRYLKDVERIDIEAYAKERNRHLIADSVRLSWPKRRQAKKEAPKPPAPVKKLISKMREPEDDRDRLDLDDLSSLISGDESR